jgi:hypothetical protein
MAKHSWTNIKRCAPAAPRVGQQNPEQPVTRPKPGTPDGAFQRPQLLPQGDLFEDQLLMPAAGQGQRPRDQHNRFQHAAIRGAAAGEKSINRGG